MYIKLISFYYFHGAPRYQCAHNENLYSSERSKCQKRKWKQNKNKIKNSSQAIQIKFKVKIKLCWQFLHFSSHQSTFIFLRKCHHEICSSWFLLVLGVAWSFGWGGNGYGWKCFLRPCGCGAERVEHVSTTSKYRKHCSTCSILQSGSVNLTGFKYLNYELTIEFINVTQGKKIKFISEMIYSWIFKVYN